MRIYNKQLDTHRSEPRGRSTSLSTDQTVPETQAKPYQAEISPRQRSALGVLWGSTNI